MRTPERIQITAAAHWGMVWEQNIFIMVMLTPIEESGVEKCFMYWPTRVDGQADYGDLR